MDERTYKKYFFGLLVVLFVVIAISGLFIFRNNITGAITAIDCSAQVGSEVTLDYVNAIVTQQGVRVLNTNIEEEAIKSGIYSPFNVYEPVKIVVGSNATIVGLSENLIGMKVGEEKSFVVPPEKAYGNYDPNLQLTIPVKNLIDFGITNPVIGMIVPTNIGNAILISFDNQNAVLDYNNVLAGQTFVYNVKVVEVKC